MYLYRILLFSMWLSSLANICHAQIEKRPVTLISQDVEAGPIMLNYKNIFGDFIKVRFEEDKIRDTIDLNINHPVLLEFNANFKQYPVYAEPGDTIYIATKPGVNYYDFKSKGYSIYRANFFKVLDSLGCGMGYPDFFGRVFKSASYKNSLDYIESNYKKRMSILVSYNNKKLINKKFYSFMQGIINQYYVQSLLTPYLRPKEETRYDMLPASYSVLINHSPLYDLLKQPQWINFASYRGILVSYTRFLSKDYLYTPKELSAMYRSALDSLSGESRDYVLFFLMKNNIKKGGSEVENLYKSFCRDCSSQIFKTYIDSLYSQKKGLVSIPAIVRTQLKDGRGGIRTWGDFLHANKGNVIYIDFWASWCGPCREQIPFSKKLKDEFRGKPVVFVYMSIDVDKSRWLNAVHAEGLDEDGTQHYLLNDKSELTTYLGVPPIPHYLIIDREGIPVFLDATRPDDPTTVKELQRLSQ